MTQCPRLILSVHHDLMPFVQHDRVVIRVANPAADKHRGVSPHNAPIPIAPAELLDNSRRCRSGVTPFG